jgi:sporulation integral membrane protein YtvI
MKLEKQKAFIIHVLFFAIILLLGYFVIKYVLPLLMPFVIGVIIAVIFRRPIDILSEKIKMKRTFVSIIFLLIFYCAVGLIITMIGFKISVFIGNLFGSAPDFYENSVHPAVEKLINDLANKYPGIKVYLDNFMNNINQTVLGYVSKASSTVLSVIAGIAGQLPSLLIKFIFTIVSSFFFTIDYYRITRFIVFQFKGDRREMLLNLKNNGIGTLGKFIKAYSTIISITFLELSIGFWIIGVPNPLLFGILVAIIDILPILGTGAVLLPWSIISFIMGNTRVGIGMLILYIVITAVRQTLEPKIVGQQIGLHPIVTLILMYIGAQLMGVLGLLSLPIIATLLLKLNEEGTIHIFRKVSSESIDDLGTKK